MTLSSPVSDAYLSNISVWNITGALNYTSSTTTNPKVITPTNKTYQVGGYNITIFKQNGVSGLSSSGVQNPFVSNVVFNNPIFAIKIEGPVASVSGATINPYYFIPGISGLFLSNGTSFSSVPLTSERGNLSYTGSNLVYTEPTGNTITLATAENSSTFYTYLPNFAATDTTKPDTWGAFIENKSYKGPGIGGNVEFAIPTENYTVLVGGTVEQVGLANYTVGQTLPSGTIQSINGQTSKISASGLVPSFGAILDSSFSGLTNTVPVIVVGGPAVNTLAAELLTGKTTPVYGSAFTNLTGVSAGQSLVEMFNNVSEFNGQPALLVAGYNGVDTLAASEVVYMSLIGEPIVNLTGSKVILNTSSIKFTGIQ